MTTDKITFEKFVAERCSSLMIAEPRVEKDGEYAYDCFDDADGNEVAFISYKAGEEPTYTIREDQ